MRAILMSLLMMMSALAGCLDEGQKIDDGGLMVPEYMVGQPFPEFSAPDENGTLWNLSMLGNTSWVAYISAEWCTHCKPTLNASDLAFPAGRLLVINKHPGERHDDMSAWKNESEAGINRTLDRPFLHAPELAETIGVMGIPLLLFIDAEGTIVSHHLGLWDDVTEMTEWWESDGITHADGNSGSVMMGGPDDGMDM